MLIDEILTLVFITLFFILLFSFFLSSLSSRINSIIEGWDEYQNQEVSSERKE